MGSGNLYPHLLMIHPKLDDGEQMVVALQDHWITMVMPITIYLIGTVLAAIVAGFGTVFFADHATLRGIFILAATAIGLLFHHWLFIYFFEHEISAWIVTTKRVISFSFLPYVKHDVTFIIISELHEIDKFKRGLLQNLLNYGTVEVNLAATPTPVKFRYVPRTSAFVNLLETLHKTPPNEVDIERLRKNYFA